MNARERAQALRLYEALDGLDDCFISESELPADGQSPAAILSPVGRRGRAHRGSSALARFLGSGWGAAVLCAVVSLGVVLGIVRAGRTPDRGDTAPLGTNPPLADTEPAIPPLPEETLPLPAEETRVAAGTRSVDGNGLEYVSYGNGTAYLLGFADYEGQTALPVADYSPDGDLVVEISSLFIRRYTTLTEVTLPAGLRSLERKTFPVDAPIYTVYGNVLYLGSDTNPYLVAVGTADNRPGATSLHPHTRIVADYALTYETGATYAMAWAGTLPAYTDSETFTLPAGLIHIGQYSLLDVGRDVTYHGYLVGWDALTATQNSSLIRRTDGTAATVTCADGIAYATLTERVSVTFGSSAAHRDGILYGAYWCETLRLNTAYYEWLNAPEAFESAPDQFVAAPAFGTEARVLTAAELAAVTMTTRSADTDLQAFLDAYNADPAALYAGQSVVMLYLTESFPCDHLVTDVQVTDGHIHITVVRLGNGVEDTTGNRFLLIPIDDPDGTLVGAEVSFEVLGE